MLALGGFRKISRTHHRARRLQPFSQKPRTPTVAKEFQIGLCGVVEADLERENGCSRSTKGPDASHKSHSLDCEEVKKKATLLK